MESREENKTYYWTVRGQRVEITEEVYRGILLGIRYSHEGDAPVLPLYA